ncbi:MAG: HD domain-containing protein [Acidimicrobiales bacterium]
MDGHTATELASVRTAHDGTQAIELGFGVLDREAREQIEDETLASGATRARGGGTRLRPEEPDEWRTCFERDRDRILHSDAFRRLAGKTQVFVFPADHQRTRLTHALEVAQVAGAIARACRLNVALAEAIALGHDCGHGPGGHASEDALSPFVKGGFDHAVWGADVTSAGLNLCEETLDGIRNHSWSRPAPFTPEGEVASLADRIAYTAHDLEDAVRAGIVDLGMLPPLVVDRCGPTRSSQLRAFINDVVDTTYRTGVVGMSGAMAEALSELRRFDYERIYLRTASIEQSQRVIEMLRALVAHFASHPSEMPAEFAWGESSPVGSTAAECADWGAVAYVAGMTDRYACSQAIARLDWSRDRLPRGSD